MREPILKPAPSGKRLKSAKRGAGRALRATEEPPPLPVRRRVPGGKAVARLLFYEQQRLIAETMDARKAPSKLPTKALFSPSAAPAKVPAAKAKAAARGGRKPAGAFALMAAYTQQKTLQAAAAAAPVQQAWRPIGPFSVPHGQTYGSGAGSRPSISGRVVAIAVDPGDARHLLVGSGGGGVWESRDTGQTWLPRTDDQPSLATGAIAFDPTNPTIAYAGTGEGDSTFVNSPNLLGVGLLRSSDGGVTWTLHARAPFEQVGFYDIVVDPLNGNHLLAATTVGLYESADGGSTWSQRRNRRTWSISMHPPVAGDANSTREVFAGCSDGVFRSTSGGATWSSVNLPGQSTTVERIEVCHARSDGNVVYVFSAGAPDVVDPVASTPDQPAKMPKPRLWRRASFGGTFTSLDPPPDLQTGQAWYDWFAAVAPNNADVLYVGGINTHKGVRSVATGKMTWTTISARGAGTSIHPDEHAIAFSPSDPNVVYVGCDGGVYRSPDGGATWQSLNKGLNITEVEFIAQHPQFEAWLLVGTQDNGTLRYQGSEVWYHVADGDGGDVGINDNAPYTCYHTFYGMGVMRSTHGGGWDSWPNAPVGPPADPTQDYPEGALFYPPVEVNGRIVVQGGRTLFISNDGGTNWVDVDLPSPGNKLNFASALAMPTATRIYVGTLSGRVYRLDFNSGSWGAPVALGQPVAGYIGDLLVDPTNPNRIFVAYQSSSTASHVFRSDDGGLNWVSASGGLPDIAANAIEIDAANPDTLFVALDLGIYRTTDAGASWSLFNNGLPNALVKDLALHPQARLLRAGTQARGVWEINIDAASMPDVEIYLRDSTVDTGRTTPSPSGVDDPFTFGAQTFWWQCVDIKVDVPTFQTPAISDVDFEVFGDAESLLENGRQFATGLRHENPQRGMTARLFVQIHNRGVQPASNVAAKVFFAPGGLTFPDLPNGFWTNFPNNAVPGSSPWQPVASHKVVPGIDAGTSQIVGFEWAVPANAANNLALLAVITADNDALATSELNIMQLVTGDKKCGLKNLTVVNPPHTVAPTVLAVPLELAAAGPGQSVGLEADRAAAAMIRALVLSKALAKQAEAVGLKRVKLTPDDQADIARLVAAKAELKGKLDTSVGYAPREGLMLDAIKLTGARSEPVVVLLDPKARRGYGSLLQRGGDGSVVGGLTFEVEGHG